MGKQRQTALVLGEVANYSSTLSDTYLQSIPKKITSDYTTCLCNTYNLTRIRLIRL